MPTRWDLVVILITFLSNKKTLGLKSLNHSKTTAITSNYDYIMCRWQKNVKRDNSKLTARLSCDEENKWIGVKPSIHIPVRVDKIKQNSVKPEITPMLSSVEGSRKKEKELAVSEAEREPYFPGNKGSRLPSIFCREHSTLQLAMSVGRSVRPPQF